MPQPILHLHLAQRALAHVTRAGRFARAEEHNAFLQGALGPDLGFFPGSSPRLSIPIHHYRTADMARALLANARSEVESAYAWGWVTHFLADVLLHPIINSWCYDQRDEPGAANDPVRLHVRVELGLDIQYINRIDSERIFPLPHCFTVESIEFLRKAYQDTYGVDHESRVLLAATRHAAHLAQRLHTLETVLAYDIAKSTVALQPHRLLLTALQGIAALAGGRETVVSAFFSPTTPGGDLALQIDEAIDKFEPWFVHSYQSELAHLPNLDLDTGSNIPADFEFAVA